MKDELIQAKFKAQEDTIKVVVENLNIRLNELYDRVKHIGDNMVYRVKGK